MWIELSQVQHPMINLQKFSAKDTVNKWKNPITYFVDWSSIEVFANDGAELASALIFPDLKVRIWSFVVGEAVV